MKNLLLLFSLAIVLMTSCKKDEKEKIDARDQFVGTYSGALTINIPEQQSTDVLNGVIIITKSSESSKIVITDGTQIRKAVVSGNKYEYEKFTKIVIVEGTTITMEMTGSGTIKDGKITESGPMTISFLDKSYTGTWTSAYTKQ